MFADTFSEADADDVHQEAVIESFLIALEEWLEHHVNCKNDTSSCESEFVRHLACPNCGSSDANSLYSDGHTFCFVCNYRTAGDGESVHIHQNKMQLIGDAANLTGRKISQRTAEKFKTYSDGDVVRHYYYDTDGAICGAKVRTRDKTFTTEGTIRTLFGMQNFRHKTTSRDTKLVITKERWTPCLSGRHNLIGM